jgi:HEXXH motif-containing protein
MHDAFNLIDRFSPEFSRWTLRLLREVIPIESGTPGCMRSGSSAAEPGRCHMSFPSSPVALAEMLIHETTHQYYYLVTRLGPVDDGTDTTLYYSPVKGCDRPIYYILIAYHAFANVLLFSQRCLAAGYNDSDGHLHRNVHMLTEWLETLDKPLRNTTALTTVGKALWLPLARRLRDASRPSLDPLREV